MQAAIDHPALAAGRTAVVTGGAGGIGLAVATRLARAGMNICVADVEGLAEAERTLKEAGAPQLLVQKTDVSRFEDVLALKERVFAAFGEVGLLMNNAAIGGKRGSAFDGLEQWKRTLDVNLMGIIHGVHAFTQAMLDSGQPGLIVNAGSKQGITNPPGDLVYNISKAGIRTLTEGLAHSLRSIEGSRVAAHLLIPGFTYTTMIARILPEKPADAWLPEQVADALVDGLLADDFYILCPDNAVTREMDVARMIWSAADIAENRPALSRWHPDYKAAFDDFMAGQ
ncbi:Short-chain dehydrogenase [Sphingobium faniae]|nr:Short-chain dehydrogenase [Sphingobium faniae]